MKKLNLINTFKQKTFWLRALGSLFVFVTLGFSISEQKKVNCKKFEVILANQPDSRFLNKQLVELYLSNHQAYPMIGEILDRKSLAQLEHTIEQNPYVLNAEAFTTELGKIKLKVWQRNPMMRVINEANENYLIDELGVKMPVSSVFVPHIMVANGAIKERYMPSENVNSAILKSVYNVMRYLNSNDFLKSFFVQIYVNEKQEIELIPRLENHIIIIGNDKNLEKKISILEKFYSENLKNPKLKTYKTINLKFNNLIICK